MLSCPYKPECALITGASSGIGAATARALAQTGCKLILAARRTDKLQALAAELNTTPVHLLELDIRQREGVQSAFGALPPDFADIDLLVNNAGLALGQDKAQNAEWADWETMVDTNIKGLLAVTRAVLPRMTERRRGHVINLGSTAGNYPYPGGNVYCGTKAFVKQFSLALRADLPGTNVRVTNIEPGIVETEFSEVRFKGDTEKARKVYEGMAPLTPEDVAEHILFAATRKPHVNINRMEIMPTTQSFGPHPVERP